MQSAFITLSLGSALKLWPKKETKLLPYFIEEKTDAPERLGVQAQT